MTREEIGSRKPVGIDPQNLEGRVHAEEDIAGFPDGTRLLGKSERIGAQYGNNFPFARMFMLEDGRQLRADPVLGIAVGLKDENMPKPGVRGEEFLVVEEADGNFSLLLRVKKDTYSKQSIPIHTKGNSIDMPESMHVGSEWKDGVRLEKREPDMSRHVSDTHFAIAAFPDAKTIYVANMNPTFDTVLFNPNIATEANVAALSGRVATAQTGTRA